MTLRPESRLREPLSKGVNMVKAMIRRMTVTASSLALWTLEGYRDEQDEGVEVFSGIGFYSRPGPNGDPEVVVVKMGGKTAHGVIVGTRDETLRRTLTAIKDMLEDETAIFNSRARVHVLADGTVVVDDGSGAVELALKSDVDTIQGELDGHEHTYLPGTGGATLTTLGPSVTAPAGTTILKGK